MSALDVWGLDDVAETAYRAMLRNPDLDVAQLARHLELEPEAVDAALDELLRVGLVSRSGPGFSPTSPATTLAALVHVELSDIEERRSRLDAVRASLSGFAADHMVGQSRGWSSMPFELLSADESFAAVEDLQRGTTGEVISCHPVVDIDVDAPTYVELIEHQLADGRPMRGLYPTGVLDDPARLAYVQRWSEAGETVRLLSESLPAVAAFGSEAALVSAGWGGDAGSTGNLLVRAPALVAMVRELFDQYWVRGLPVPTSRPGDADDVRPVLELLQLGLKDETIARQLGVSLRTVRRRVATVMDELGATTRFQAGMEAVRRGLI
jgi:DNA-binding Lrp family transcriptional regulator